MAVDIYLTIPGLKGPSTNPKFPGAIELNSFSFGVENPISIGTTGGGAGKITFSQVNVVKAVDQTSPLLLNAAGHGTHFATATLSLVKVGGTAGTSAAAYLVYEFKTVYVSTIQTSASSGGDSPVESVGFEVGAITIKFTPQNPTGGVGTPVSGGWNRITNTLDPTIV